jgi:uncharacterized protein (TIGR02453 family)
LPVQRPFKAPVRTGQRDGETVFARVAAAGENMPASFKPILGSGPMAVAAPFTGFSRAGVQFLVELAQHNERAWFQPRKQDYERLLKEPLEALCLAMAERFEVRHLPLRADPRRSPFRIYRDTRFSADKTPYKTHVSASFPWIGEGGGVGAYFHFGPGEVMAGGGMWHPEPARLASWRRLVDREPQTVRGAIEDPSFVAAYGQLGGDRLKRVPAGFSADHPMVELLKLKDVTFGRPLADEEILSPKLPDVLADSYEAAIPVLALLAALPPQESRAGWLRES